MTGLLGCGDDARRRGEYQPLAFAAGEYCFYDDHDYFVGDGGGDLRRLQR